MTTMEIDYYYRNRKRISFISFCRDVLIAKFPDTLRFITRKLLPYNPDFIFFTHPRNEEDIYATLPFIKTFEKLFSKKFVRQILNLSPCYVVAHVQGPLGKKGYVISVTELPETMFTSRELTMRLIRASLSFFRKISRQQVYVGLAAWWPIVSNSGLVFLKYLKPAENITVTSGHTATLASIYLSILKLTEIARITLKDLKLLIIGAGKVGGSLGDLLAEKVGKLGLVDKNPMRVQAVKVNLEKKSRNVIVETIPVNDGNFEEVISKKLGEYDMAVCTTSNTGLLIRDARKLKSCIVLDDSRPEAFPRIFSAETGTVVLEGGLMKIPGVSLDSDFGFGKTENIFGCLSEAIILALDRECRLKPNVGDVDYDNLFNLIEFCRQADIGVGDFKCGQRNVSEEELSKLFSVTKSGT